MGGRSCRLCIILSRRITGSPNTDMGVRTPLAAAVLLMAFYSGECPWRALFRAKPYQNYIYYKHKLLKKAVKHFFTPGTLMASSCEITTRICLGPGTPADH